MVTEIKTASINGIDSRIINVETDISTGLPGMELIGFLSGEVKESKDRVRVALKNSGITFPACKITINLAPADIRKDGTGFDLPIAVSLLAGLGIIKDENLSDYLFAGELSLDGEIKRIKGILPIVLEAKKNGIKACIIPKENVKEGSVVEDIDIYGVENINELILFLNAPKNSRNDIVKPYKQDIKEIFNNEKMEYAMDYLDVSGQDSVKRALEIAASGFHNVLIIGSPGTGKSMMAKRLPTIMPPLTLNESLEVSKIYSVCGLLNDENNIVKIRPFIAPHHSISQPAMAGGGKSPTPGVISKSHKGVLFLDEVVHFPLSTIEVLRQPMEDKSIHVARTNWSYTFPADFMLVAAMNPCPCGYYPDRNKCNCTPEMIKKYISKLSGPVLDRIDICVEAEKIEIKETREKGNVSSREIRDRVTRALEIQKERYKGTNITFNSQLNAALIKEYIVLGDEEVRLLDNLYQKMNLSIRGYHRILKVARTIADLDEEKYVLKKHILEAVCYRSMEDKYFGGNCL